MAISMNKRAENCFSVGSFDAKTHFAELLRTVEAGASVIITRNGKDIAEIASPKIVYKNDSVKIWEKLCKIGAKVSKNSESVSVEQILEWRDYGRK